MATGFTDYVAVARSASRPRNIATGATQPPASITRQPVRPDSSGRYSSGNVVTSFNGTVTVGLGQDTNNPAAALSGAL